MVDLTPKPARNLAEAIRALNAEHPLESGDLRYVDLAPGRGANPLRRLERLLLGKQPGVARHVVFLSHRGAGKTTELHRLQKNLAPRYHCVYFEANVEMDANQLDMEDLLLVLARQVDESMRTLGHPLAQDLLDKVGGWFAEVVKSTDVGRTYTTEVEAELKAGAETTLFGGLMGRLTSLFRYESSHREEVKQVLRKYPGTLMDLVNELLDAAHRILRTALDRELLVVIDNMDRYDPVVMDQLLVRQADRFSRLKCNLVITPPILLAYQPQSGDIKQVFESYEMPAVQIRKRDEPYDRASGIGSELLLKALGLRVDLDRVFPGDDVRNRLLVASGGGIRGLIKIALESVLEAEGDIVTLPDVERAAKRLKGDMRMKINANGWAPVLVSIADTKQISENEASMKLLFLHLAFQYNGDTWHDIHPLVAELPEFTRARAGNR